MLIKTPTRNLLSLNNSLSAKDVNGTFINPETYQYNWTSTNSTLTVNSNTYVHPLQYSFAVQPLNDVSPVVISLKRIIPPDTSINGGQAQFHCQIQPNTGLSVDVKITNVVSSYSESHNQVLTVGKWNGCWSPVIDVGLINTENDDIEFEIDITVNDHGGQVFFLSVPTLMNELGFTHNTFVHNMRKFIPSFIWDRDKIQEYPNYPFAKLLYVLTNAADKSTFLYKKFYQYLNNEISVSNQNATFRYSQLVNPEYVDEDYEIWLSQFNGTKLYRSVTTTAQSEAITNVPDSISWQLKNAYFGRNSGTFEAIKECTKQVLTGNKIVYVFSSGSFFQINIYTLLSETPGVENSGDSSPEVIAITNLTKPMGFVLSHQAYNTLPLILDDPIFGALNTASLA
jgi:hypothetical protein